MRRRYNDNEVERAIRSVYYLATVDISSTDVEVNVCV